MDNYGNDYFMSQEGYASIDFTLLDRPNSNIASAPESTAALLPDLHVGDSAFPSFDFLDGSSVEAFGGVLREADEAQSRDQGGYRYELQKNKKERSLLQQGSVGGLHRGDGDPDSELPSSEFHIPFEVQKPISNLDFFSQGHTKDSGNQEQQAQADAGNDATDGNQDYFEQGQMSQQAHTTAGAGGWYNNWPGSNSQGDQTQGFLQNPSYDETSDERRMIPMKGNTAQLSGQMGYQSPQVPSTDSVPKATHSFLQTTHSFLPTAKQSDSRQASNTGLGLLSAQGNVAASSVVNNKSSSRHQALDYDTIMNGASANQFRQNSAASAENASSARRHQTSDANVGGGQDGLRGHAAQSQNYNKYAGQNLGAMAPVEVSPLKVNDYDFLGGQQYGMKGQQLAVDEMQTWHQHPLLSQSNQQQTSYQHQYQDLPRHHQQQHHVDQQPQQNARQQHVQQFMAANHQNQSLGNQLSAFLTESSLQEIPRVADRQNSQMGAVDNNPRALLQTGYPAININATNLNWSATPDPSAMEGLAHDYLMGAGDQNFNWQALALKASQQVDPQAVYGSLPVNRRDTTGQQQQAIGPYQQAMQGGSFQDYYGAPGKLAAANAQVEKPVARNLGGPEASGGSLYGGSYQAEVYEAAGNLHSGAQSDKHQALGKMPFWQNPYPHQTVEQSRSSNSLGQTNLPPRSPQVPAPSQSRQQRNWSGLSRIAGHVAPQSETLQGGIFAQNLANAEALKQSILAGGSIQQNTHQAAADLRPSARSQSSIEAAHYLQQQSGSQAGSGSQFLSALSTKQQQSNWNRLNLQQSVPQTGVPAEAPSNLEVASQKNNWTSLNIQQASPESQSLANLNKQQNLWGGHNSQQGSRPAPNSLHLFTDLDGRRNSMQNSHDIQQGTAQQAGKIDVNLQGSRNIQPGTVQGNDPPNTLLDLETSQQSGWRDHSLLQGTSQANNSLNAYNDLDKTSSWRNIWQTPSSGEASSQLLDMDDGRHQQNTLWGHSLQKSRSDAVEAHVAAAINPREQQSAWGSSQDVQQERPQTDQLLSSLEAEQQQGGSHRSHTLDDRNQSGQFSHLLHEEQRSHSKTSVDVDARHTATQGVYSLQAQVVAKEKGVRHKAIQNAYNLQSQVGMTETDPRHKASQDVYSLQGQLRAGEAADSRAKNSLNAYNLQAQLASAEAEARHKAASHNPYNLQAQVALGEADVRQKNSQQNMYTLQSQVGMGEKDGRHKVNHNSFSSQSHLGAAAEKDSRHRSSQNVYNLQSQVGSVEPDAQLKARQQNVYNLQSQVASAAEAEARLKASQNTYSLQSQVGAYSQPSNLDGRQGRSSPWSLGSQQGNSQSAASMFVFPSMSGKNQNAQNSANLSAWNASVSNVEGWQKSGTTVGGGLFQHADLQQVENVDSRHQNAQTGGNPRHSSPQNENHLQSISSSRPSSRLGRPISSLDTSLSGTIGLSAAKPTSLNHWQSHGNNISSSNTSQNDVLPTWSQGGQSASPARGDVEKFNTGGDSTTSGTGDVLPQWSRGQQQSLTSQQDVDQVNYVGRESNNGPNEVLPTWSRGQSLLGRKDMELPTFGGESRLRGANEAQQTAWSRGQNLLAHSNVEESSSELQNDATRAWPRQQQSVPARKDAEQLTLGELNREINEEDLPAWSRGGQSAYSRKDGAEELDVGGGESNTATEDLPVWSRGQQNKSARSVVDQLDVVEESNNGNENEGLPAWSRGQTTPSRKETQQANIADETSRGSDLVSLPAWSRGQSAATAGRDAEEVNADGGQSMGNTDAIPAWSQGQHVLSMAADERPNQVGDVSSGGTNLSVKEPLIARPEGEKRAQAEMSLLDRATLRESNSVVSPAPSPESNLFSSSTKQKPSTKTSSLSRNTLELLSRPEEPNESSSLNEEEMEEEELDMEDSGVNASGISLAHLRRPGQASGPLSPQGFGLRLAPPSHLSQKSQDASRIVPTQSGQDLPQSNSTSGGNDPAVNDQMDPALPNEAAISSLAPAPGTVTAVPASSQQDSHSRPQEHAVPTEPAEHPSVPPGPLDGSISQAAATPASDANQGVHQPFLGVQNSAETGQEGAASEKALEAQGMDPKESEDGNDPSNAFGSSQANVMGHLTSGGPQNAAQHLSTNQQMQQSGGGVQTAALSKLLSTFKDSLSGQPKQTSSQQQQGGNTERGNAGVFESAFRPQVGSKQVNGLQPGQWGMDPSQVSSLGKAELFKRLAAQVGNNNQAGFGQIQQSNNISDHQNSTPGEPFLGKTATQAHYFPGQQAFAQSQIFPGQQFSQPGQKPSNQGQGLPGQESTGPPPHSGQQIYGHVYNQSGQGMTMDKTSHQGYLHTHSHTLSGQQGITPDQQHLMAQHSQNSSGQQTGTPGQQSYPGQPTYAPGQALPGQVNVTSRPYAGQQTYNSNLGTPGKSFSQQQSLSISGPQSVSPGQALPGPETPGQPISGQVISPAMASKQSKARQQRKMPPKAPGNDVAQTQIQQGRLMPQHQPGGNLVQQQSLSFQQAEQSPSPAQMGAHEQHQYGLMAQRNDLSSSAQMSQEDTTQTDGQPVSQVPAEGLRSKDPRAGDNRGSIGTDKAGAIPGSDGTQAPPRSSLEQQHHGALQDSNPGNLMQQWHNQVNAQALSAQSGISDYQFQRILESRPNIVAALEAYKGNPRLYQLATAQIRASLNQQQMAKHMGQYQQQLREQQATIAASSGALQALSDGAAAGATAQAVQASQQAVQAAQSMHASQAAHAQAVHRAQAAQVHAAAQAAEVFQAAQASQAAQAAQGAQAVQAAQAAQAIHAAQAAQQAAQSGQSTDEAAQAVQAAIISKNANTAARLQYLSQMAQRGQNVNGMSAPWFPGGLVGRPGANGPPLPARMVDGGKGPDSAASGAPGMAIGNDFVQNAYAPQPHPKKRKEPPSLPLWREVISQAGGYVSTTSGSELEWATATNRVPEMEARDETVDVTDSRAVIISRAKSRLRLTSQLTQQITPAVPANYMKSNSLEDRESATYLLSKLSFAEACRISSIARRIREVAAARDAEESRIEKERELAMEEAEKTGENTTKPLPFPTNIADRFKLRMKHLENDLQRLENSPSAVDLVKDMQDTERIALVNRLIAHHSPLYSPQNSDFPLRAVPQKYVSTVQMPNNLPEGLLCVSL